MYVETYIYKSYTIAFVFVCACDIRSYHLFSISFETFFPSMIHLATVTSVIILAINWIKFFCLFDCLFVMMSKICITVYNTHVPEKKYIKLPIITPYITVNAKSFVRFYFWKQIPVEFFPKNNLINTHSTIAQGSGNYILKNISEQW